MKTGLILLALSTIASASAQYQAVYLHTPDTIGRGFAWGAADGQRVGSLSDSGASGDALLWTGSNPNYTILTPTGYSYSAARGASGGSQVGYGGVGGRTKALLWHGTGQSAIDLDVTTYQATLACG